MNLSPRADAVSLSHCLSLFWGRTLSTCELLRLQQWRNVMIQIEECASRPAQSCCFCRGEYIRITYTLRSLFRAAFCIQNNIKGLFILHCLPFVLSEAVEAGRVRESVRVCTWITKLVRMGVTFCLCGSCGVSKNMLCKCLTISNDG